MGSLAFWKAVVVDESNFLERIFELLDENGVGCCAIGGVAVNAYVAPVVTEDLDLVVGIADIARVRGLAEAEFKVREFEHSLNVYDPGSRLRVQFRRGAEFEPFLARAQIQEVLGLTMPVASPADLIDAKVAAATEPTRRPSKRGEDKLDLARLVTRFPELLERIPPAIRGEVEALVDPPDGYEE